MKPPKGLTGKLRELFCEQEQQRQELLLQHSKERVSRLIVTVRRAFAAARDEDANLWLQNLSIIYFNFNAEVTEMLKHSNSARSHS